MWDDVRRIAKFTLCLDDASNLTIHRHGQDFLFRFDDGLDLLAAPGKRQIDIFSDDGSDADDIHHYILDQVIPRILAEEGALVLHAGAVVIEGQVHIFTGPSGIGKSTLCAGLAREGAEVLSDDAVILRQEGGLWLAKPVYPGLRLLPDALKGLGFEDSEQSSVASYTEKQRVLSGVGMRDASLPVAEIHLLTGEDSPEVRREPVPAAMALISVLGQTFAADPKTSALRRLRQVSGLLGALPANQLRYPRSFDVFPALIRTLKHPGGLQP